MPEDDLIVLEAAAADAVRTVLANQGLDPATAGLRVSVERGGCAGLSYELAVAAGPEPGDLVREGDGVRVFVDPASEGYLGGAAIDLASTAHGTGFTIENPNASEQCGCGLSFR